MDNAKVNKLLKAKGKLEGDISTAVRSAIVFFFRERKTQIKKGEL